MIDQALVAAAKRVVASKPRNHITPAMLLAAVMQESSGVNYFTDFAPDSLFHANVTAACRYYKKKKLADGQIIRLGPYNTGFSPADIKRLIAFPAKVSSKIGADWAVPPGLIGKFAKFRFEYGYWENRDIARLPNEQRFYASCSWGVVQFMGPNISKEYDASFIRRFAADIPLQLLYGAGELDKLLTRTDGDLFRAYKAYNSGNPESQDPEVIARANAVVRRAALLDQPPKGKANV